MDPVWEETKHIILLNSQIGEHAGVKVDDLRLEIYDENNLSKDKLIGQTDILSLRKWIQILDPEVEKNEAELRNMGEEWGLPDTVAPVWKKIKENETAKSTTGDVKISMTYHSLDRAVPAESTSKSGVLEVIIHQAKEIPIPAKSCHTYVQVAVHDKQDGGRTPIVKRSNAPVWEQKIRLFISDTDRAKLKFALMDTRDANPSVIGSTVLKVFNLLEKKVYFIYG